MTGAARSRQRAGLLRFLTGTIKIPNSIIVLIPVQAILAFLSGAA
jgi:hypothetical protein